MFLQAALTVTHGFWLSINTVAIGRFMVVSFTFISPGGQQIILRRFVAHESVPRDLEDHLTHNYLANPEGFGLLPRNEETPGLPNRHPSIQFGRVFSDSGVVEVEKHLNSTYSLHDVRFNLVKWVATRWLNRTTQSWKQTDQQKGLHAPTLVFPIEIGQWSFDSICLCRQAGGSGLTGLEKKIIKRAFIFREVE